MNNRSGTRVRFAPSPTGSLHIGGARTALFNYLFSQKTGGSFILRIDDTDSERCRKEHEQEILTGLRWLGIEPDEGPEQGGLAINYRQSERREQHLADADQLCRLGTAYKDKEGAVRLKFPPKEIIVTDLIAGECRFAPQSLGSEPVLVRSDGLPTYHLASVSDDVAMGITHVIRGIDHLTNTAKHQLMFQALSEQPPQFAHLPLILGEDGTKLSKRRSSDLTSLSEFQGAGYLAEAVINFLLLLGWSHPEHKEVLTLAEAVASFDLERVGHTASIFNRSRLDWLNGLWIRKLPPEQLVERLIPFLGEWRELVQARGTGYTEAALAAFQEELTNLREGETVGRILAADRVLVDAESSRGVIETMEIPIEEIARVVGAWHSLVNESPTEGDSDCYTPAQVAQLLSAVKKSSGAAGPKLFKPLRLAIMGSTSGPELKLLLPLIPRNLLNQRARHVAEVLKGFVGRGE